MTESSIQNPYSPPAVVGCSLPPPAAASKRWVWWIGGTVVAEILVTFLVLIINDRFSVRFPLGVVAAAISGAGLIIVSVLTGRLHHLRFALALTQAINLVLWLTMLVSFLLLPRFFGDSTSLVSGDYKVLAMLWLAGAAVALIIVFAVSYLSRTGTKTRSASLELHSAESGDAHEQ